MDMLSVIFPRKCVFCGLETGKSGTDICVSCRSSLPWWGGSEQVGDVMVTAPLLYEGSARRAMIGYKFYGRRSYAKTFGKLISVCVRNHYGLGLDIISFVPLHWIRQWKRGYNQSKLMANEVGKELGIMVVPVLKKPSVRKANSKLTAEARADSVKGAFRVCGDVRGKRILLIDDVCTTGSTLSECSRVLYSAGAKEVVCATLCRTK